jgi:porin
MRRSWPCVDRRQPSQIVRSAWRLILSVFAVMALELGFAHAQEPSPNDTEPQGAAAAPAPASPWTDQPSIRSSIPALGDFKKALLDRGFNLNLNYIQDTFGNPTGGVKQGATYESVLYMVLEADLARIAGLSGATFRVNAYQIQGLGLSTYNIFNYSSVSSLDARPATRLYELWVELKLFADMASIRIGQLAADNQFFISDFGNTLYINSTFGWPNIINKDLPGGGGPNYPLTTPGARLKVTPNDQITLLAAIFNGDPAGSGFTGLQEIKDSSGTNFRLKDPPLLIGEGQFSYNQDKNGTGLAGTIKLGAWYHFGPFNDRHFGVDGESLANALSGGVAQTHNGDYGVYGVIDQMLWRLPGDNPKKGVGAFSRVSTSPSDRNLIDFYAEAGVNFMGVWDARPDDSFGLAAAFSQVSPAVHALDAETAFFTRANLPARNYELVVELTYQAQIVPGWIVQPDFQYIFHPGGGGVDPVNPAAGRIPDAAVFGVRTMVSF